MWRILYSKTSRLWAVIFLFQISCVACSSLEVDQKYFGVAFNPIVKNAENGSEFPSVWTYDFNNVKTMMTLVSKKFSTLYVRDDFTGQECYCYNSTYKNQSSVSLYTGEAAAEVNKENKQKRLSVFYGVVQLTSRKQLETAILLAFEAAEKANSAFPDTVEAVLIDATGLTSAYEHLQLLRHHKSRAVKLGIKLGADLNCLEIIYGSNNTTSGTVHQIINESDYIMCSIVCDARRIVPADCFGSVSQNFLKAKSIAYGINANTQVMGVTEWHIYLPSERENAENLKKYWQEANQWAVDQKFKIFLREAIDKPMDHRYSGWWKLKDNSLINSVDGYVEKILYWTNKEKSLSTGDSPVKGSNTTNADNSTQLQWTATTISLIISAAVVLVLAVALGVAALYCVYKAFYKTKQSVLSRDDIKKFRFGASKSPHERTCGTVIDNALEVAYDETFEISKDKIKIDYNAILGSGQFGIVFKAMMLEGDESGPGIHVALKVAKENCNSTALLGLLSEIKIMTYLGKHANIVALYGAYTAELTGGVVYVATELCASGSLQGYLRNNVLPETDATSNVMTSVVDKIEMQAVSQKFSLLDMIRWSHEIACGMEHLQGKHVVHADLAARNVLLTCNLTAKVADFGLSRRMYEYANYMKKQKDPLPWRWMAIESLKRMQFSSKSDVWSFGITLWEIFSKGDTPYPGQAWTDDFVIQLVNGKRPTSPEYAFPEIYNMMQECWQLEAEDRPDFCQLVKSSNELLQKYNCFNKNGEQIYLQLED